jgi:hypothetical protein
MMQILGIIYCLKSDMYTFSNDCPASKAGFMTTPVQEWVCGDGAAKRQYAINAVQTFTKKNEDEFVILRINCLIHP